MRRPQHEALTVLRPTPMIVPGGRRAADSSLPILFWGKRTRSPDVCPRSHDAKKSPTQPPSHRPPRAHWPHRLRSDRKPAGGAARRRCRHDAPRLLRHLHRRSAAGRGDLRRPLQRRRRHALRAAARRGAAKSLLPRPPSLQAAPLRGLRGRRRRWQADRKCRGLGDRSGHWPAHEAQPPVFRRQRPVRRVGRSFRPGSAGGQLRRRELGVPRNRARWSAPAGGGGDSGRVHPARGKERQCRPPGGSPRAFDRRLP